MTPSVLERLRPTPMQPDPTWAALALDSILRSSTEPQDGGAAAESLQPAPVGEGPERSLAGPRRRMALAAAAVAVLAGAGVGLHLGLEVTTRTVLANPAVAPPHTDQDPVVTDLGPLSADRRRTLVAACTDGADPSPVVQVHYARSASDGSREAPRSAAVVEDRRGEYRLCVSPTVAPDVANTMLSGYGPGVLGPGGDLTPTRGRPLSLISAYQWRYHQQGDRFVDVHLALTYAVAPGVDRVEVRLTGAGADGRWFTGTVHGGFVYLPVLAPSLRAPDGKPDVAVAARGYGADGRLVASATEPDLDGDSRGDDRFWRH